MLSPIEQIQPLALGPLAKALWFGAVSGFMAGITLVLPYVVPFYILLAIIEDSGYLTRISLMLDRGMHKLGLHGRR
jgi:ferrous iron transport protein B